MNYFFEAKDNNGFSDSEINAAIKQAIADLGPLKKVLLIPPDITRLNAYAGPITKMYYDALPADCEVEIMPALGTHMPMNKEEIEFVFPGLPTDIFVVHDWRNDVVKLGEVPQEFVAEVSENRYPHKIDVEVNRRIVDPSYDLIVSIGQVVPHEVVGMANYNKNIFVGCGGSSMINSSHIVGALYGLERMMGRDLTPVHKIFDYAEAHFLQNIPLIYTLTVTTTDPSDKVHVQSLAIGRGREIFTQSIKVSQKHNLEFLDEPIQKAVVYLKPEEFRTTWVGNKAIYRTRMAMADGGDLIIIAPGVMKFGEDPLNEELISKYGYHDYKTVTELIEKNQDLQENLGVAAHLIHGSSEGRFTIYYAAGHLTPEQVTKANFSYMPLDEALERYPIKEFKEGYNDVNGEKVFYISNPALGLWAYKDYFYQSDHQSN